MKQEPLQIGDKHFTSRLLIGTGKFSSNAILTQTLTACGAEIVTVALRRIDLRRAEKGDLATQDILKALDSKRHTILPNTAGAQNAAEAIRLAHLARELSGNTWVKLEVTPEPRYLLPDPVETLQAATTLVKDGFTVLPYMHADPVLALRLQDVGCVTVMPLGSPIGSNQGIRTTESIRIIIEQAHVPVIVDAGLGLPSHAAQAMEMGADAVLVNTALAVAQNPPLMARAFAQAVEAGRLAYLHGSAAAPASPNYSAMMQQHWTPAAASSPLSGLPTTGASAIMGNEHAEH